MKYYYILLFTLYSTISLGQYVPPMFKLNLVDLTQNGIHSENQENFEFQTAFLSMDGNSHISNNKYIYKVEGDYIYILTGNFNPRHGDIFHLIIKNKISGYIQNIYIKPSHKLSEGEVINIENLSFEKGNYFFDLDDKESKYYSVYKKNSISTSSSGLQFGLEFKFSKKHKISDRKLKKIIEKHELTKQ